jgi:hypothetical protein
MSKELREAAEEAEKLHRVSPPHVKKRRQCELLGQLARAVLAEHPADDGERISQEWFDEMYEFALSLDEQFGLFLGSDGVVYLFAESGAEDSSHFSRPLPHIKTRVQFRNLCKVLGIPLKESVK